MFDMNPLNVPDSQLQQWIMLFVAGTLGFIIGYISRKGTVRHLDGELAHTTRNLDDCLRASASVTAGSSKEEVAALNRIATRASELNFERIGYASADEADDLKVISGVGPFLEKKLHAVGIYTFRQIANFNKDDIDQVNDVIEFFPGRIERENWVGQSAELVKNK
jgi:predicted flap endonuclease-1-like 5' DNA nuclease